MTIKGDLFYAALGTKFVTEVHTAGKKLAIYSGKIERAQQTYSGCNWIRTSAQTPMMNKQEMLVDAAEMLISKNRAMIFGIGVVMESWRENNIKNEEQKGKEKVEDGIRKATFRSASACVRVRENIF
ncbi:hypothetical protein J6590_088264 [Homalodisca vitripennis]|nr:hypothetical protein J6590_088264 [Homalodisca vitripennis]